VNFSFSSADSSGDRHPLRQPYGQRYDNTLGLVMKILFPECLCPSNWLRIHYFIFLFVGMSLLDKKHRTENILTNHPGKISRIRIKLVAVPCLLELLLHFSYILKKLALDAVYVLVFMVILVVSY